MADWIAILLSGIAIIVNIFGLMTYRKAHNRLSKANEFYKFSLWMFYAFLVFVVQNLSMLVNAYLDGTSRMTMNVSIVLILFTGIILIIAADVFSNYSKTVTFRT